MTVGPERSSFNLPYSGDADTGEDRSLDAIVFAATLNSARLRTHDRTSGSAADRVQDGQQLFGHLAPSTRRAFDQALRQLLDASDVNTSSPASEGRP